MNLNKKQAQTVHDAIEYWNQHQMLESGKVQELKDSVTIRTFDWKRLARYSFWISIACIIISITALMADEWIRTVLDKLLASNSLLCFVLVAIASLFFWWGWVRKKAQPHNVFSNEALICLGVLATAGAIAYFGKAMDTGSGHFSILFLLSTIIYGLIGWFFPSRLVWIFSLLSIGAWFGAETGYASGWGAYFLGMNYPMRFVVFGGVLIGLAFWFLHNEKLKFFYSTTYKLGLLYLFIALWILSIFGNYGDWDRWSSIKQYELLHWGVVFAAVAIAAIYWGLKTDDSISRGFGVTFLIINLYTKYFEYFWNATHKAIFFMIMAVTFWFIGRKAESIWNLQFLKKKEEPTEHS